MPGTDNQGSFLYRISIRRNQFAPMDTSHDQELEDLELLQKHVADRFSELLTTGKSIAAASGIPTPNSHDSTTAASESAPSENEEASGHVVPPKPQPPAILSIAWLRKLLDMFLCCDAEFKAVLISGRDPSQFSKPPLDRLIPDLLDRSVKALDICNSVNHGIDLVQHWQKVSDIAVTALCQTPLGDGQVRRARKALTTLLSSMAFDDKESTSSTFHIRWTERTRSFRRFVHKDRPSSHNFRSLSWSVAKSWSAAKQIQNMSANLVAPRGAEANGPALSVYIINNVLLFIMWALVAAIPCQDRNGFPVHSQAPRNMGWAQPIVALHDKICEDWKKKEKKGTVGLLEEIKKMEKLAHSLAEFADGFVFPMEQEEEKKAKLEGMVAEMAAICGKMEEGLAPLQQQVREVFHKIVRSRAELLEVVDQVNKMSTPVPY